jgi:ankyrin repeat protein
MKAAESGVPEVVEQILAGHADVNAVDEQGRTAVFYVLNGAMGLDQQRHADRGEVVRLLTRAGADLNAQDEKGNTALHETHYPEIAAALIKQGADVNARNNEGETPLMTTYSLDVMKLLVASGADVHAKDSGGKTALDHVMEREIDGQTEKYLRGLDQQAKK